VTTRNVGVELIGSGPIIQELSDNLLSDSSYRLIIDSGQRQQLLALNLLTATDPIILSQFQQSFNVSRTTLIKDLRILETWFETWDLSLKSRPNYGYEIVGGESLRRQAIAALLWGNNQFEPPISEISYGEGLQFTLESDLYLLPGAQAAGQFISQLNVLRTLPLVAEAEAKLNGRLNDEAVLYLALYFAVQRQRIDEGFTLQEPPETIEKLKSFQVWSVSKYVAARLGIPLVEAWSDDEVANIAIQLLTTARNERWPTDLDFDSTLTELVDFLMEFIAQAYKIPKLANDTTFHDGLAVHIIPACLRARFGYKAPPYYQPTVLSKKYTLERQVAEDVIREIEKFTGITLPESDVRDIALLLRAAYIRERPNRLEKVLVICPSGMAVAQLLVARLKARFPRLGSMEVVSVRRLTDERLRSAQLVITTVPLPESITEQIDVIQVHPLLMPEDIEKITRFMA
jgi:mannitol operon transcriptional antiterminator